MDSLLEYTRGSWIMITLSPLAIQKTLNWEWYLIGGTNMIKSNLKQNSSKTHSLKKHWLGQAMSRLTLSIVSVFPTAAVPHPNLPQPHQLHEHQGGRATVTVAKATTFVFSPALARDTSPTRLGREGALLKALWNWGRKYLLYLLFDLVFWFPNSLSSAAQEVQTNPWCVLQSMS